MSRRLSEAEGYALLEKYGIRVPKYKIAGDRGEAGQIATEIGFPVVMKIVSTDIIHKSDAGGVRTGIADIREAEEAYDAIVASVRSAHPGAAVEGVIVEEHLPPGREFIVGGTTDPAFGRVLAFGSGGVLVELLDDTIFTVLPADEEEIRGMVRRIRGYPLIRGYRNLPPLDEEALIQTLRAAAALFENEEISEFDINPLILYPDGLCAVDARFVAARPQQPRPPERPPFRFPEITSVAVIGASADPTKVGYSVLRNLLSFNGAVYPVNPKRGRILGLQAYPSVLSIGSAIDCAVIAVPAPIVPAVLEECGRAGIGFAVIVSAGFRESGADGEKLEAEVLEVAHRHGIRILGPNCLGIMLPGHRINATFDTITPLKGHIGFLSQSGAVITTAVDWAAGTGIGFSAVVSVGNSSDLGFADLLPAVADVPGTRAVILYIEEIRDGERFLAAAREIGWRVPVIAVKSGVSERGKQAAASHTGSLAGSAAIYAAAFEGAGIIGAGSMEEAFQIGELLASEGYPAGERAVVVSGAGGYAVLASDYAEKYGVSLIPLPEGMRADLDLVLPPIWNHANPMDIIGDGGAGRYARVFDILIDRQDEWDVAFVVTVPSALLNPVELAHEIVRFSGKTGKMIVSCMLGGESMAAAVKILKARAIPNFPEIEDAFRAVGHALAAKEHRHSGAGDEGR
ncbi:acetate--CoA ligase family protein [Methanofollis fontis]|nr:acetate--CoA ligase family protein [Methanofollis fontis]